MELLWDIDDGTRSGRFTAKWIWMRKIQEKRFISRIWEAKLEELSWIKSVLARTGAWRELIGFWQYFPVVRSKKVDFQGRSAINRVEKRRFLITNRHSKHFLDQTANFSHLNSLPTLFPISLKIDLSEPKKIQKYMPIKHWYNRREIKYCLSVLHV